MALEEADHLLGGERAAGGGHDAGDRNLAELFVGLGDHGRFADLVAG